jgi:predicted permease
MDTLIAQVRHASRLLLRSPLFALTAVVSLALGIGANAAIFTVINGLLLAPTPGIREMSRLVDIGRTTQGRGFDTTSYPTYQDLAQRDSPFNGVYALRLEPEAMSLGGSDVAERIYGESVSASYFDVLGLTASAGTFFHTTEEQVGVPLRKVVLSHAFWQSHFAGRADVAGQELVLNGDRFTIVGVGPIAFHGTTIMRPDVWVPMTAAARGLPTDDLLRGRENQWLIMGARLKAGATVAGAQVFLDTFSADLLRAYPEVYRNRGLAVLPASRIPAFGTDVVGPFLALLMAVVGLVLLVACLNLSGLLLARATVRAREVAVRLALGASRGSIAGMLLIETLLLFALGSLPALAVAAGIVKAFESILTTLPVPVSVDLTMDWRVMGFTAGLALVAALLTGLAPALQSARASIVADIKMDAGAPRRQRLRRVFITAQLACCLVLVVTAGLFARALGKAGQVSPGFDVDRIDVATIDVALGGYTSEQAPAVAEQLRTRMAAIPGVEHVGLVRMVPLEGGGLGLGGLRPKGLTAREDQINTDWNVITPEYFDATGIPILRGRNFATGDRHDAPGVAIVNQHFADHIWPGREAIGQQLEYGDFRPGHESDVASLTVIGVARDAKYRWIGEEPAPFIYVPLAQQPMASMSYLIRRAADLPAGVSLTAQVRQAVRAVDPNVPLIRLQSLRQSADLGMLPQHLAASIAGTLGVLALLLAAVGVYGVTAFAAASRAREFGVRMALGADRGRILRMVMWQGAKLCAIGGAIGLVIAVAVTQLLSSLLFGISPLDPVTYAGTVGLLAAIALAATLVPARRAAGADPLRALKSE